MHYQAPVSYSLGSKKWEKQSGGGTVSTSTNIGPAHKTVCFLLLFCEVLVTNLFKHWKKNIDAKTMKEYYVNEETKEQRYVEELWEEHVDPSTGKL